MGLSFRKSLKLGPLRINLSKRGVGYSVGGGRLRTVKRADGGSYFYADKSGLRYNKSLGKGKRERELAATPAHSSGALAKLLLIVFGSLFAACSCSPTGPESPQQQPAALTPKPQEPTTAQPQLAEPQPADAPIVVSRAETQTLTGKIVSVTDGNTARLLDAEKNVTKIRLQGVAAPWLGQPYGHTASKALYEEVFGKDVKVLWREHDEEGDVRGHIYLGNRWINRELVAHGLAWHDKRHNSNNALAAAEAIAREAALGLWHDSDPTPPWTYRHDEEQRRATKRSQPSAGNPRPSQLKDSSSPAESDAASTGTEAGSHASTPGKTVDVKGYYRKDGTYVQPHTRAAPGYGTGRSHHR